MESKILHFQPITRADSQPAPHQKFNKSSDSTDQKSVENDDKQSDSKSQQHNTNDNSAKQHARPIKEIRGILKGKMKQRTFVVVFSDTEKEETVPIAQMHKYYLNELLDFYEAHITQQAITPTDSNESNQTPKPANT